MRNWMWTISCYLSHTSRKPLKHMRAWTMPGLPSQQLMPVNPLRSSLTCPTVIPSLTPAEHRGNRELRGSTRKQDIVIDLLCLWLWLREKENMKVSHLLSSMLVAEVLRESLNHPQSEWRCVQFEVWRIFLLSQANSWNLLELRCLHVTHMLVWT